MKVVKMTAWEDAKNYPQCFDQNNYKDFWDCVKKFLVEKNLKSSKGETVRVDLIFR